MRKGAFPQSIEYIRWIVRRDYKGRQRRAEARKKLILEHIAESIIDSRWGSVRGHKVHWYKGVRFFYFKGNWYSAQRLVGRKPRT